jgi:threonylcarbamoyladenosine tRNA methylthiotransferase MtaB
VIQERKQRLLRLAEQHAFALRQSYIGQRREVLLENDKEEDSGRICGHTDNFLRVSLESKAFTAGDLIEVELIANEPDSLLGKIVL